MTEVKKADDNKPKYEKPVVVDLGEPITGEGGDCACNSGSAAGSGGCCAGGSGISVA